MAFTWFATFEHCEIPARARSDIADLIAATPGLSYALLYTPWPIEGLHYDDGTAPALQLQLYFEDITPLERALLEGGHLQALTRNPALAIASAREQTMIARSFLDMPKLPEPYCTYLVHYPGPAENLNHWHQHYLAHHVPVMQRFPGIRGVEICTALDWCSALPWARVHHMQRNKVVFDDADALKSALASPIMDEMRADLGQFPAFCGGNAHFAMRTHRITP